MSQVRTQIFTSSSSKEACDEIIRLEKIFLEQFGRKISIELYFSSMGEKERPIYGVTAYYEDSPVQKSEIDWLLTNVQ